MDRATNLFRRIEGLLTDPALRDYGLSLYRNIPLRDLWTVYETPPDRDPGLEEVTLSYVFCRGSAVLLAMTPWERFGRLGRSSPRIDTASVPGLLLLKMSGSTGVWTICREKLEEQARCQPVPRWHYQCAPLPEELEEELVRRRMLARLEDGETCPTPYGTTRGLGEYCLLGEDGTLHCRPVCSPSNCSGLSRPWRWVGDGEEPRRRIPLRERLEGLRQGLPESPENCLKLFRRFAAMPLSAYLGRLPKQAEIVREDLGLPDLSLSFGEAAILTDRLLAADPDRGRLVLYCLACPLVAVEKGRTHS